MPEPTMGEMACWTFYQRYIAERTRDVDPRHIEAWMRLEHPTLDGLSEREFSDAMYAALATAMDTGPEQSETLAASFGLQATKAMIAMTTETTVTMRRCIGSTRFGIEAHDQPADEFPVQPSQKDGLGRMCHTHWRAYTNALRKAAVARKAEASTDAEVQAEVPPEPGPEIVDEVVADPGPPATPSRRTRKAAVPETGADAPTDDG